MPQEAASFFSRFEIPTPSFSSPTSSLASEGFGRSGLGERPGAAHSRGSSSSTPPHRRPRHVRRATGVRADASVHRRGRVGASLSLGPRDRHLRSRPSSPRLFTPDCPHPSRLSVAPDPRLSFRGESKDAAITDTLQIDLTRATPRSESGIASDLPSASKH